MTNLRRRVTDREPRGRRDLMLAVLVVVALALHRGNVDRQANFEAVIRSCEILNDKIVESQEPPPADSSTVLLIKAIVEDMTPAQRAAYVKKAKAESKTGGRLAKADCEREATKARDNTK
jgi:hypothetical protein